MLGAVISATNRVGMFFMPTIDLNQLAWAQKTCPPYWAALEPKASSVDVIGVRYISYGTRHSGACRNDEEYCNDRNWPGLAERGRACGIARNLYCGLTRMIAVSVPGRKRPIALQHDYLMRNAPFVGRPE